MARHSGCEAGSQCPVASSARAARSGETPSEIRFFSTSQAAPTWLAGMLGMARESGADLVGGPVVRRFENGAPAGLAQHPLFYSTITESGETASLHGTGK